ncbi:MAG: hypothetical protein ACI4B3_09135 [Prevotella sp.]
MNEQFQDRIDDFLLGNMTAAEQETFLQEVACDEEKREQLEFTKDVKDSICSREEKLRALSQFKRQYEYERRSEMEASCCCEASPCPCEAIGEPEPVRAKKRKWLWIAGVAAVLVVGFFAVMPTSVDEVSPCGSEPMEYYQDSGDFCPAPIDSAANDTTVYNIDEEDTFY